VHVNDRLLAGGWVKGLPVLVKSYLSVVLHHEGGGTHTTSQGESLIACIMWYKIDCK
jgi:hypothetical protein